MSEKGNQAVKTVSFMMLITLFGKILGLVREQLLAANYATGMEAAAFLLASRIPRTFFDVIFASAISASFIPIFVEYLQKKGKEEAFALANRFITMISTVTIVMMLLGMVLAEPLTWLIAPGYDVTTAELCVELLRMLFPTMLFTAVAFSFVGILQSLEEFNVPAALSVASNGVLIVYYIFFNEKFGIFGLTVAFLIGWAMQAIIQIPSLHQKGYHYRPDFHFKDEGLKKIGKLMLPVMVSTWIQPINFMVNTRFASQLSSGNVTNGELGVSALEYANNLYTIIVGVFVLAIANMVFPKFSRMTEDKKEFGLAVRGTLKAMIFLLIPMTVGLMALAEPIVTLIYKRGAFDMLATELTSKALFFFALGMVGYGVQNILSRAFYANQDGKTPFYSGLVSIVINAVLCWLLLKPMGIGGLALAAAVSSTAAAAVLMIPAVKQYPDILDKSLIGQIGKMFLAAVGMLVLVVGCRMAAASVLGGLIGQIILLCLCGGVGVVSYMVFAKILKIEESDFVFDIIKKILRRGKGGEAAAESTAVSSQRRKKKWRTYSMIEKISFVIEDSFCFRVVERIWNVLMVIWMDSIAYSIYAKICASWKNAFENSAILHFLRANWDKYLHTQYGVLPRFWRNLTQWSGMAVRRKSNGLAVAMGESFIFRVFNQNFLILCLAAIVAAIPIFPTMLLAVLVLGTFALYFVQLFLGRIKMQKTSMVSVLLGCFAACVLYAGVTSYAFPTAILATCLFLILMAVFFVAKDAIDTEEKLDFILWVLVSMGALIALYAVYQYIVGVEMDAAWVDAESFDITTRAYATFNNPNVLGEYLILVGSLAAGMMWKMRNWFGRLYYTACFGVICLGLVATGSRGAMLGLMFSAGLFVLLSEKRLIPLGIILLLMMPFILPASLWARLASSVTMSDSSSLYRMSIYSAAFDIIRHYWATGIGVGAFNQIYPLFSFEAANAYHAHNLFLQEFIELGVIGFIVMVLLFIFFFQKLYSAMRVVPKRFKFLLGAVFGGFAGLLLQGITDHLWFDYRIVLFFWCFIGIGMAAVRVGEKKGERETEER
ncbi:murein biosynthesis integral membrane protein MurJ [Anaerotignum sp.]|nr:murein biosynthesis integral membrane protein MurJ [Anaerotignum sp.]MBQ7758307.1 murein biosynthesis integral membrane protein MurJ [Anaerotignum sp.]